MALARATHHAVQRHQCTQTVTLAATNAATLAPSPVFNLVVPALVVTHDARAPVFEYLAPAPVIEYIAPATAMTYAVPSQQLPPAVTMTTVTADVNFDITGLVNQQFSITAVEAPAPQVVGSLPSLEEFDAPMYNKFMRNTSLQGRRPRTKLKIQLCKNR